MVEPKANATTHLWKERVIATTQNASADSWVESVKPSSIECKLMANRKESTDTTEDL